MKTTTHPNERVDGSSAIALGVVFGTVLGSIVFALTQDPVWMGLCVSFGIVGGAVLQTNQRSDASGGEDPGE